MTYGYIVKISGGLFNDTIVSLKSTPNGAINDGMKWYREAAAKPQLRPTISISPVMVAVP